LDLSEKVYRASKFTGPKLFIALSPCPPGWEIDPEWSIDIARSAVETGIWPLKEAVHGEMKHTYVPRKFEPVEKYLKRQGRFRHLFEPKRDEETIAHIQATVDEYWKAAPRDPLLHPRAREERSGGAAQNNPM
jgi:pyruvate ferredoxin oxidoreductase beta subunit